MGENIKNFKNKLLSSSFFRLLFFATASNLLQALSVYYQKNIKNLNDSSLAMINYGIYFIGFYGIIISSLSRWLILKASVFKRKERIPFLRNILKKSSGLVFSLIILLTVIILSFNPPNNLQATVIVGFMVLRAVLFVFIIFPNAYLTTLEAFIVIGITNLVSPIMRMLFTLIITDDTVWVFFISFIVTEIIVWLIIVGFISKKEEKSLLHIIKDFYKFESGEVRQETTIGKVKIKTFYKDKIKSIPLKFRFNSTTILKNMALQVCLVSFYVLDGIILERFLTDFDYVVYTTYAFVFKLPLFISINIMNILLGREVILGDKSSVKKLIKTLLVSISLIVFLYLGVLGVEEFLYFRSVELNIFGYDFYVESLLSLIGYTEYLIPALTLPYGLAWLLNTVNSFLYTYLLKTRPDSVVEKIAVIVYGLSYLTVLLFFNSSLITMMWLGTAVGGFFCFVGVVILLRQIKRLS